MTCRGRSRALPTWPRRTRTSTAILAGGFQVAVAEDSLTLTGPDGKGLVYRAAG